MEYTVDPGRLSAVFNKLQPVDKGIDGRSRLKISFGGDAILFTRSDREHSLEFAVPAEGSGTGNVVVDWVKFSNIIRNGVSTQPVTLIFKEGDTHLKINQAVIKMKIPVMTGNASSAFEYGDEALEYRCDPTSFFKALKMASILCVDKIVGRGKYSGVMVYPDRIVACSHEGAVIVGCPAGTPDFGIPYNAVWSLLGLTASDNLSVIVGEGKVPVGHVRGVFMSGDVGGVAWTMKFAQVRPNLSVLGMDLGKPTPGLESSRFGFTVEAAALKDGFGSAASIQGKPDVWVDLVGLSADGLRLRATDVADTTEATNLVTLTRFSGGLGDHDVQLKRVNVINLLSSIGGEVEVKFDDRASRVVFNFDGGEAHFACGLKEPA